MTDRTIVEIPLDAIVDHPDQPRYGVGDVKALADSIKNVGLLEPVLVVGYLDLRYNETRYRVLAGHRRVAAMVHLGRTAISAIDLVSMIGFGRDPDVKELDEIAAIMASNTAREQLTPLEEARGYQTMLDLGVKVEMVARMVGAKRKHVERLSTAIKQLGRDRADGLAEVQLTVEEMEGLARFAGDEKRYGELASELGKPGFAHTLSRFDWALKAENKRAAVVARLNAEGCPVITGGLDPSHAWLTGLRTPDGEKITPEDHASCPGHAAQIGTYNTEFTYICRDWEGNGHARANYGDPTEDPTRVAKREERERRTAALDAATAVRRPHVERLLRARDLAGEMSFWAVRYVWDGDLEWMSEGAKLLALELLGWKFDPTGSRRWIQAEPTDLPANLTTKELERALVALAVADMEIDAGLWNRDVEQTLTYLRLLERNGYELSEVEREIAWPEKDGVEVVADAAAETVIDAEYPVEHPDRDLDDLTDGELLGEFLELHKLAARQADGTSDDDRLSILASELESRGYDADDHEGLGKLFEDVTKGDQAD